MRIELPLLFSLMLVTIEVIAGGATISPLNANRA